MKNDFHSNEMILNGRNEIILNSWNADFAIGSGRK